MAERDQIQFDRIEKMKCPACRVEIDVSQLEPFSRAACPSCGAEMTVAARLSNYLLQECLGSGGMGSVYRAYDETLDREVAIKVMKQSLGNQPEFLASFRREAQAAAKLNHPNIAQIYSFGEEKGQPYIVMEYVPGKHLEDMIESDGQIPQELVMKIGMDLADGLQLATASNLIHGDIKPGNILLDGRDSPKLVDFGIASSPDAEQTEIWGTPYYIAPEKVKREKIDFRSDMYCLGGTLYHALTKKPPFDGDDAMAVVKARLSSPPRRLRDIRPDISPVVERIILKMLEFDPQNRYASYGELMSDIKAYLDGTQGQSSSGAASASKRIIIKGRSGKMKPVQTAQQPEEETPAPAPDAAEEAHASGSGKIRITKKRSKMHLSSGSLPADGATPDGSPPGEAEDGKRGKSPIGKVLLIVGAAVLLVVIGVVSLLMNLSKKKAEALRRDKAALVARQTASIDGIFRIGNNTARLAARIAKLSEEAEALVGEAVETASKSSGQELASAIREEAPFEFPPFDDSIEAEDQGDGEDDGPGEEKDEGKDEGEGKDKGKGKDKGEGKGEGEDLPGLPAEILATLPENIQELLKKAEAGEASEEELQAAMTPEIAEQIAKALGDGMAKALGDGMQEALAALTEQMKALSGGIAEDIGNAMSGDAEDAAGGDGDGASDGGNAMDEVSQKAREIFLSLAPVRKAKAFSDIAAESVYGLAAKAVAATNLEVDVASASLIEIETEVSGNLKVVERITQKARERYDAMQESAEGLEDLIKSARKEIDALKAAAAAIIAENERRIAQEKAEEEARIERERKEAEEAARRAAEEAEINKVRSIVPAAMDNVMKWKFDHISRDLDKLDGTLTFKSAQKALKAEKRRVEALKNLKAFLIARLNSEDKFAHRRDRWSILSANDRSVEIKPAKKDAKPVNRKWEELGPEQIVPIIMHYILDKDKAKAIPLRERAGAYIDASVYFLVLRGDDESAVKAAQGFAERVESEAPSKKGEFYDTLYELKPEAGAEEL